MKGPAPVRSPSFPPPYRRSRVDGNPSQAPSQAPPAVDSRRRGNDDVGAPSPTVWGAPPPYRRSRVDGNPSQAPSQAPPAVDSRRRGTCGVRRRPPSFPCRREPIAGSPHTWIPVAGMTMWARRRPTMCRPPCGGALPPYRVGCAYRRSRVDGNPSQAPLPWIPAVAGMTMSVWGVRRRRRPSFPWRRKPIAHPPPRGFPPSVTFRP